MRGQGRLIIRFTRAERIRVHDALQHAALMTPLMLLAKYANASTCAPRMQLGKAGRWKEKQTRLPGRPLLKRQHALCSDPARHEYMLQDEILMFNSKDCKGIAGYFFSEYLTGVGLYEVHRSSTVSVL